MGIAPTLYIGARLPVTDYVYGDPDHPGRVTRSVSGPLFTIEDHALLAALTVYEDTLCPGCNVLKVEAWHSDMEGWYDDRDDTAIVCHSCTAQQGREVSYGHVATSRDFTRKPLPAFDIDATVTRPSPPPPPT